MRSVSRRSPTRCGPGRASGRIGIGGVAALALLAHLAHATETAEENVGGDPASLERLHDVVSLPPVSWWPVAPGWYGLAFVATVALIALLWRLRRHRLRDRYRHEALAELAALRTESLPAPSAVARRMVLLKRTALSAYPRAEVASLSGAAWWRYLDEHIDEPLFAPGLGAACEALAYRDQDPDESEEATHRLERFDLAVEQWILRHHSPRHQTIASADLDPTDRAEAIGAA